MHGWALHYLCLYQKASGFGCSAAVLTYTSRAMHPMSQAGDSTCQATHRVLWSFDKYTTRLLVEATIKLFLPCLYSPPAAQTAWCSPPCAAQWPEALPPTGR